VTCRLDFELLVIFQSTDLNVRIDFSPQPCSQVVLKPWLVWEEYQDRAVICNLQVLHINGHCLVTDELVPSFEWLLQTGLPLKHTALQTLLVFHSEQTHYATLRDRAKASNRLYIVIDWFSIAACNHYNIIQLQSVFNHLSRPTTVDGELALGGVQSVEKWVGRSCDHVSVEQRARNLVVLRIQNLYRCLRSLRVWRNWHDKCWIVLSCACVVNKDVDFLGKWIRRRQSYLDVFSCHHL